jgi:hypothetical protein
MTSFRLPGDWHPASAVSGRELCWQVTVIQRTEGEDGEPDLTMVSPLSEIRCLTWD